MVVPPVPPVEWVSAPVKPTHRTVGPPPRQAQSQTFNPLAASPGVNDPFYIRQPYLRPPEPAFQPKSQSFGTFRDLVVADTWVPSVALAFRHTTTPKPQSTSYQPVSDVPFVFQTVIGVYKPPKIWPVFRPQSRICNPLSDHPSVDDPWLIVVQLYDPLTQGPKPNKQAKSRFALVATPNVPPNVILSPWIQSAQYASRIRALKLHPSSTRWFPGGIYAGPTDPGAPLEGRNELGDLVGAGVGRGAAGSAGGASGRGTAGSAGSGSGRGTADSAGAGTGRGSAGSVGPGGGRT
jgi:hypothetical protein